MEWGKTILSSLEWGKTISNREGKERVADIISSMVKEGEIIGVGSGSTAYLALLKIARRMKNEQLHIRAIPTSQEIRMACVRLGIPVTSLWEHKLDWTFDGANEIDTEHNMIKGRGGAIQDRNPIRVPLPGPYRDISRNTYLRRRSAPGL